MKGIGSEGQSRQPCEIVWAESRQSADLYKKMPTWTQTSEDLLDLYCGDVALA